MDLCHRRWWLVKPSGSVCLVSGACFRRRVRCGGHCERDGPRWRRQIGRIADYFVPSVYWKLGGNHRGAASVAFLEDFQKIVTGGGVERLQAPVIENEKIGAAQVAQKTRMASVATRQSEGLEEPRHALIEDRAVVATRLVAERRGQPALADAGWADERQIIVSVDPFALGQLLEQGAVKTAGTAIVNVFDAGLLAQFGDAQPRHEALVLSP